MKSLVTIPFAFFLAITPLASDEGGELGPPMRLQDARAGLLMLRTELAGVFLPAPTLETEVVTEVTGLVARTAVEQSFHNPTEHWVEGVYVFPLPEDAAVDRLRLRVGERIVEGEKVSLTVGVVNQEKRSVNYEVYYRFDDADPVLLKRVSLSDGERWEGDARLDAPQGEPVGRLAFLLYKDAETEPSHWLYIWLEQGNEGTGE